MYDEAHTGTIEKQGPPAMKTSGGLCFSDYYFILKLSFSDTERLNTGLPGLLSRLSTQKYPSRMN
jgi:hypothetical protein